MSGIPSWARVGAKVVWQDVSKIKGARLHNPRPRAPGLVVEISGFSKHPWLGETIVIKGWPNQNHLTGDDYGWVPNRFRPLVTRTQEEDVALFAHLLDGKPVEERV